MPDDIATSPTPGAIPRASKGLTRRQFLAGAPAVLGAAAAVPNRRLSDALAEMTFLNPIPLGLNPLKEYPNRDWEDIYRDVYTPDSSYHYLCAPNDTHGCLLKANVKNGVVLYADPSFKYEEARDVYGNAASARWNPRACISGDVLCSPAVLRPPGKGRVREERLQGLGRQRIPP